MILTCPKPVENGIGISPPTRNVASDPGVRGRAVDLVRISGDRPDAVRALLAGVLVARCGVPLADMYLEFLGGRCRPNTVLAAAYDLKVFFTVVGRPPDQVRPVDVLAFITAQRTGRAGEHGVL